MDHNKLWKILKEMIIPDHLTCLLRNLYAGQEATVITGHGTTVVLNRKRSVFIPISKKGNAKECLSYCTIALISHAGKGMLKILHVRLQQYMNRELPGVQAGFRKGRQTREQLPTSVGSLKK